MLLKNFLRVLPQYLVPQHALSRFVGLFTQSRVVWFKNWLIKTFIGCYGVDMSSALQPDPYEYATFNDFFTRKLRTDARAIANAPQAIISPADGCVSQLGKIKQGQLIQAKGIDYSVQALLGGNLATVQPFLNGDFITIYLAPKDYHRVHLPMAAKLREMIYVPGDLFSVNTLTTETVTNLFSRNERVIMLFDTAIGAMAVIMVGAMLVANIHIAWEGIITPPKGKSIKIWNYAEQNKQFAKGDELGYFQLGSTAIVLFADDCNMQWEKQLQTGKTVQFGQLIGTY